MLDALRGRGVGDVLVFGGGIIPEEDEAELQRIGVSALFAGNLDPRHHRLGRAGGATARRGEPPWQSWSSAPSLFPLTLPDERTMIDFELSEDQQVLKKSRCVTSLLRRSHPTVASESTSRTSRMS